LDESEMNSANISTTSTREFPVRILPRPKARSEWQKPRLLCHSERSEESRALIGRIRNEQRKHFHYFYPRIPCSYSSSPKSSFRMTKTALALSF